MAEIKNKNPFKRYANALLLTMLVGGVLLAGLYYMPLPSFAPPTENMNASDSGNNTVEYWDDSLTAISTAPLPPISTDIPKDTNSVKPISDTITDLKIVENRTSAGQQQKTVSKKGKISLSIMDGLAGRKVTQYPNLTRKFTTAGKVAVNIRVNKAGRVTRATLNTGNTTIKQAAEKNLALDMANDLQMSKSRQQSQTGVIAFTFKFVEE